MGSIPDAATPASLCSARSPVPEISEITQGLLSHVCGDPGHTSVKDDSTREPDPTSRPRVPGGESLLLGCVHAQNRLKGEHGVGV